MRHLRLWTMVICGGIHLCCWGTPAMANALDTSTETDEQATTELKQQGTQTENGGLKTEADDWLSKNISKDYSSLGIDSSLFTLASKPDTLSAVNQKYTSVMEELSLQGYGSTQPLADAALSEYKISSQKLFTESFGNLSKTFTLKTPKIPKSINSSSYLKKASKARNQAYKEQKKSSIYKRVKKEVDSSKSLKKVKSKL